MEHNSLFWSIVRCSIFTFWLLFSFWKNFICVGVSMEILHKFYFIFQILFINFHNLKEFHCVEFITSYSWYIIDFYKEILLLPPTQFSSSIFPPKVDTESRWFILLWWKAHDSHNCMQIFHLFFETLPNRNQLQWYIFK